MSQVILGQVGMIAGKCSSGNQNGPRESMLVEMTAVITTDYLSHRTSKTAIEIRKGARNLYVQLLYW